MTLHVFSRRRLLGGLLSGLAACLCPRSPRTDAPCRSEAPAPNQPKSAVFYNTYRYDYNTDMPNGEFGCVITYVYDGKGRSFGAPEGRGKNKGSGIVDIEDRYSG